jgi:hypothetical protein
MSEITRILSAAERGDPHAEQLLPLVYDELRKLAAQRLAQEKPLVYDELRKLVLQAAEGHGQAVPADIPGRVTVM